MINFKGQVALVTGAGRGLGRLYAIELARRGASVVINDLGSTLLGEGSDAHIADDVVREIRDLGGTAVASYESVATSEGGQAIIAHAIDSFGRLDAVVSNAGIFGTAPFDELAIDDWNHMLSVHLDGAFYLSQPAYRVMKSQGYGRFVFISSSAGMFGQPNSAHYAAAEAGVIGLTNVIAIDGAEHGIVANSVLPIGFSRMVADTIGPDQPTTDDPFFSAINPDLVVPAVVYLASRDCSFTHQNFSACAGRYARVFVGLGEGWFAGHGKKPNCRRRGISPRQNSGNPAVYHPNIDR
jgi:NAD(P)-dependent dehydrogenase (short-subunit alcohol dehydrogenase family)